MHQAPYASTHHKMHWVCFERLLVISGSYLTDCLCFQDQFSVSPEDGSYIASSAQENFWKQEVLPRLPDRARRREGDKYKCYVKGKWRLNGDLMHYPPGVSLNGAAVTVDACCRVPVFVWAPTLAFPDIAEDQHENGQAPCPCGGFDHDVIHHRWSDGRCAFLTHSLLLLSE